MGGLIDWAHEAMNRLLCKASFKDSQWKYKYINMNDFPCIRKEQTVQIYTWKKVKEHPDYF